MAAAGANSENALGFLTVVEDRKHGLFGGYLLLNRAGRPLEFHCTAPVRPNRAQEILYGSTLRPYLYGEQIGRTLLEQGKRSATLILTDCEPMLEVAEFATSPVLLVGGADESRDSAAGQSRGGSAGQKWRIDAPQAVVPKLHFFTLSGQKLALRCHDESGGTEAVIEQIEVMAASLDLAEPFQRIRAAIDEARRGGQ